MVIGKYVYVNAKDAAGWLYGAKCIRTLNTPFCMYQAHCWMMARGHATDLYAARIRAECVIGWRLVSAWRMV